MSDCLVVDAEYARRTVLWTDANNRAFYSIIGRPEIIALFARARAYAVSSRLRQH